MSGYVAWPPPTTRRVGRLLHDFNTEFDDFTPGPKFLARRLRDLIEVEEAVVLLVGEPEALGLALLRFRPSLWKDALDSYLEELYVVPDRRGDGMGRALMETAIDLARERGAWEMLLGTSEDRHRRPQPLREPRLHQPRGRPRRAGRVLATSASLSARRRDVLVEPEEVVRVVASP